MINPQEKKIISKRKVSCNVLTTLHMPIDLIATTGGVAMEEQNLNINLSFLKSEADMFGRCMGIAPVVQAVVFPYLES